MRVIDDMSWKQNELLQAAPCPVPRRRQLTIDSLLRRGMIRLVGDYVLLRPAGRLLRDNQMLGCALVLVDGTPMALIGSRQECVVVDADAVYDDTSLHELSFNRAADIVRSFTTTSTTLLPVHGRLFERVQRQLRKMTASPDPEEQQVIDGGPGDAVVPRAP